MTDEERARHWLRGDDPDWMVSPDDVASLAAEFAACRAEGVRAVADALAQHKTDLALFAKSEWNAVSLCEFIARLMADDAIRALDATRVAEGQ